MSKWTCCSKHMSQDERTREDEMIPSISSSSSMGFLTQTRSSGSEESCGACVSVGMFRSHILVPLNTRHAAQAQEESAGQWGLVVFQDGGFWLDLAVRRVKVTPQDGNMNLFSAHTHYTLNTILNHYRDCPAPTRHPVNILQSVSFIKKQLFTTIWGDHSKTWTGTVYCKPTKVLFARGHENSIIIKI